MPYYFNFNETQHSVPHTVRDALIQGANVAEYYVDPPHFEDAAILTQLIATRHNVDPANIVLSNGSNDVMHATFNMLKQYHDYQETILFVPNYESALRYSVANRLRITPVVLDHTKLFEPDINLIVDAVKQSDSSRIIIYFSNPNNPVGVFNTKQQLLQCIEACETIPNKQLFWIFDEAYIELADPDKHHSFDQYCTTNPNMVVLRTFSKYYQLSGARVGFGISTTQNVSQINEHISTDCLNMVGIKGAIATFDESLKDYYSKVQKDVAESRKLLADGLLELGIQTCHSFGNFVFCRLSHHQRQHLIENGIIIGRLFDCPSDNQQWSRVTVGTLQNVCTVLDCLKAL